jgi:hypothetical protein
MGVQGFDASVSIVAVAASAQRQPVVVGIIQRPSRAGRAENETAKTTVVAPASEVEGDLASVANSGVTVALPRDQFAFARTHVWK